MNIYVKHQHLTRFPNPIIRERCSDTSAKCGSSVDHNLVWTTCLIQEQQNKSEFIAHVIAQVMIMNKRFTLID